MFYLFVEKGEGEFFSKKKNAPLYYVQNIYMSKPFYLIYMFFLIFHFFNLYFKTSKMRSKNIDK